MMRNFLKLRVGQWPIRVRLTYFYLATLMVILLSFAAFVYLQVRHDLYAQVDSALELAAIQAVAVIDLDEPPLNFENIKLSPDLQQRLANFSTALFDPHDKLLDSIGVHGPMHLVQAATGYQSIVSAGIQWRTHAEPVVSPARQIVAWVQVAQSLAAVETTLANLRFRFLIGIPLALVLAGISGLFLARQAMAPINRITQTAQAIHEGDLAQRINYLGPTDEIGTLAATFDQMLSRLQAAFERQLRFTSDAAHELRTPLGALKARIGVMVSQQRAPAEYEAALYDMERQVDRLTRLTQDLLFIARLDQQRHEIAAELIDFDELMAGISEQLAPLAAAKSITIHNRATLPIAFVGDVDLLICLFLNLLDNAIKYTPSGGTVSINSQAMGATVAIAIQDNGAGIAPEHLPHLFDRFYRVESARTRTPHQQSGSGLGLAIAYEIARLHGGHLLVESALGHGSTFTVELPAVPDDKVTR